MMLRRLLGLDDLPKDRTSSGFDVFVRAVFYIVFANVVVLFFLQGGYDIEFGPIHLHAYSLRNWLVICFAMGLATTWLEGGRAGVSASEWTQSPLLLFLGVVTVYYANGHTFETADTLPARYLPVSLILDRDFYLDEWASIIDEYDDRYFVMLFNEHLISSYPPWGAVLAIPVYLVPVLKGAPHFPADSLFDLEKRAAVVITALSVVILLLTLRMITRPRLAWFISIIYAFGTTSFTISSQAMWQHGPSQLFIALTLYCLVRGTEAPVFTAWAGLPLGIAFICRPLNLVMALPIVLYVLHKRRSQFLGFMLAGVPPILLFASYNALHFGSPVQAGFGATVVTPGSLMGKHLSWFRTPLFEGLAGVLFSPARGLFIYSPVLVLSFVGIASVWRERKDPLLMYLSTAPVLLLIPVATLVAWWGGHGYGPRLLSDSVPILCILLVPAFEQFRQQRWLMRVAVSLAALSIGMHAVGYATTSNWDSPLIDFDKYPERVWYWVESPPVILGTQLCAQMWQVLSTHFRAP